MTEFEVTLSILTHIVLTHILRIKYEGKRTVKALGLNN